MNKKILIDTIKEQIKKRMEAKNLSTYSLEKNAGLGRGIIGNIVYDKSKAPRIDTLQAIAEALECKVDDLLIDAAHLEVNSVDVNLVFIESLFMEVINEVLSCLRSRQSVPPLKKIIFFIQESYVYCLTKKNEQLDNEFIEWLIDNNMSN